MPDPFGYFGIARVNLGGQEVVITRTGYTNELGWEFYTEPHHDADALWNHIKSKGAPWGVELFGLDSMHIRRIEAGILNAGADFNETTTPFDVGLGKFVDLEGTDFIGKAALLSASRESRLTGIRMDANNEPHIGADVLIDGAVAGKVTAGAVSPYLQCGIGIALLDKPTDMATSVAVGCLDGSAYPGKLVEMPFYDKECLIPRGKLVDVPSRT